jgi:hypothetical protein
VRFVDVRASIDISEEGEDMKRSISIVSEMFENGKTGESVEGVTIMIDGILKEVVDILRNNNQKYESNVDLIADALMQGLEIIRDKASANTGTSVS